jgi:hypothetical protein
MPSQERLRELFKYDPETGKLFWRVRKSSGVQVGQEAGCILRSSANLVYRQVCVDNHVTGVHRIIYTMLNGPIKPSLMIDHIDGDGLNNRPNNLRAVSRHLNGRNTIQHKNNTSGFNGVHRRIDRKKGCWRTYITIADGKEIYIGSFETPEEAYLARTLASLDYGYTDRHGKKEGQH